MNVSSQPRKMVLPAAATEVRHHPPYQTRHTYACWSLTARGNLAFIANQMEHRDYSMLVEVYGRWIDSESPRELGRIWAGMKKLVQIVQNLPQIKMAAYITILFK